MREIVISAPKFEDEELSYLKLMKILTIAGV
jgi:hypothetical protein